MPPASETTNKTLKQTPLHAQHVALGAKMVAFASYDMPVQYPTGVLKEHNWTRTQAGLFDVSHMGQARLVAEDGQHETVARALESCVPADMLNLARGRQRYTQLLNDNGGIIDDLMVSRSPNAEDEGSLIIVVNASRKEIDFAHLESRLPNNVQLLLPAEDQALVALQGPKAETVLTAVCPDASTQLSGFMQTTFGEIAGAQCYISRSGYTGEDGYEIAMSPEAASQVWQALLGHDAVAAIGLGARDSLRLEAGLCLYGHDIDETTSPIESGLRWSIQKRRRESGGFPGADRILREIRDGPARCRVGIKPDGRAPAREGTPIHDSEDNAIGEVTSGGFGPTTGGPVAMGYVDAAHQSIGTPVSLIVRGKALPASIVSLPFVAHNYKR